MAISTSLSNGVLSVSADNPPVNALSFAVRKGIADAIFASRADPQVRAVLLRCEGRTFFAGADITEFSKPMQQPDLNVLVDAIEACTKPVIAAMHGTALGGGLEVALACHYRIAVPSARLGLPEVKLGILPAAGGTQRLPRLIGLDAAIPMIVTGDPVTARHALDIGLIDRLAPEGELDSAALAFAIEISGSPIHPRTGEKSVIGELGAIDAYAAANARKLAGLDAPREIFSALRAAVELPFLEGRAVERAGIARLAAGTQSKALQHAFFAERSAARIKGLAAGVTPTPVSKVGVIGAGTMGGGIAMNFLSIGMPVVIVERDRTGLDRGCATIRRNFERSVQRGRMSAETLEAAMDLLQPTLNVDDLADCDLIIEAVFERMDIKRDVFAQLDRIAKPGAILATNTSFLDVDEIARSTARPEAVIGLHFFSPANVMRLLEVVRGARTAPSVLATAMTLARKIGKIAVVSGVCHGFIGNRMLLRREHQAVAIVEQGASPADVDKVLTDFGFPMGSFQMNDLAGLDIGWSPDDTASRSVRERMCEAGLKGQKTGHGYYLYDAGRKATPSPQAEGIIRSFAREHAIPQRVLSAEQMIERLLYPMINEAALILEEGIAQRASDIDTVWLHGYGWPAHTGGPTFWADTIGLAKVVEGLAAHRDSLGPDFRLSALLREKAEANGRFNA